jgi:hypothetical protein
MAVRRRRARVADLHEVAGALPGVSLGGTEDRPCDQVSGKNFLVFRNPPQQWLASLDGSDARFVPPAVSLPGRP